MTRTPTHPGAILAEELQERGITASEAARALHVPTNRVTQILKGERAITAGTALRLARWLGTSAEMWLNLQTLYELRLAEQKEGAEIQRTVPQVAGIREGALLPQQ
ncbi:MAG TPA: HigA family addiction module antitoxin [Chloroflexia bacterium]|nr:HigA family addiction module antitoxin [Chloroflexia bacterium]